MMLESYLERSLYNFLNTRVDRARSKQFLTYFLDIIYIYVSLSNIFTLMTPFITYHYCPWGFVRSWRYEIVVSRRFPLHLRSYYIAGEEGRHVCNHCHTKEICSSMQIIPDYSWIFNPQEQEHIRFSGMQVILNNCTWHIHSNQGLHFISNCLAHTC